MRKMIIAIVAAGSLMACGRQQNYFADNVLSVKEFDTVEKLEGTIFMEDEYGQYNIICLKDYFVITSVQREYRFFAYSYAGDSLGGFGTQGPGPNELMNIVLNGVDFENNRFWINDVSKARLCEIDVKQSLERGECTFNRTVKNLSFSLNALYINDTLLISEGRKANNYSVIWTNPGSETVIKDEDEYRKDLSAGEDPFSYYRSLWRVKPDKKRMVASMFAINQLNFMDLLSGERFSLAIFKSVPGLEQIVDKKSEIEKWTYYCDLEVTENYVYALYMNQSHGDVLNVEKEQEIHVFDWEGKALHRYILPHYIKDFTVNEKESAIYGLTALDEKIYKYTLF
jgi:hypothetical protein